LLPVQGASYLFISEVPHPQLQGLGYSVRLMVDSNRVTSGGGVNAPKQS
jgi:hypothetical protein